MIHVMPSDDAPLVQYLAANAITDATRWTRLAEASGALTPEESARRLRVVDILTTTMSDIDAAIMAAPASAPAHVRTFYDVITYANQTANAAFDALVARIATKEKP